ncbi:MAG: NTP transferase domain-containing protein [Methylococcaceae bacterium]
MKVLILAAGIGTRISRHLKGQPKCCVDLDGKPLIWHTFNTFNKLNFHDIAIVTGYEEQYIFNELKGYVYKSYRNPFYSVTNSLASMWFAKDFIDENDDLLILNGDLFFEDSVLKSIVDVDKSPVFLSDCSRIEDADYRFYSEGDRLLRYGKDLSNEETTGEYVGIAKINRKDIPLMKKRLDMLVNDGQHTMWWEDLFYSSIEDGEKVYIEDVKGKFWAEVDFIEDYKRILEYIENKDIQAFCKEKTVEIKQKYGKK